MRLALLDPACSRVSFEPTFVELLKHLLYKNLEQRPLTILSWSAFVSAKKNPRCERLLIPRNHAS